METSQIENPYRTLKRVGKTLGIAGIGAFLAIQEPNCVKATRENVEKAGDLLSSFSSLKGAKDYYHAEISEDPEYFRGEKEKILEQMDQNGFYNELEKYYEEHGDLERSREFLIKRAKSAYDKQDFINASRLYNTAKEFESAKDALLQAEKQRPEDISYTSTLLKTYLAIDPQNPKVNELRLKLAQNPRLSLSPNERLQLLKDIGFAEEDASLHLAQEASERKDFGATRLFFEILIKNPKYREKPEVKKIALELVESNLNFSTDKLKLYGEIAGLDEKSIIRKSVKQIVGMAELYTYDTSELEDFLDQGKFSEEEIKRDFLPIAEERGGYRVIAKLYRRIGDKDKVKLHLLEFAEENFQDGHYKDAITLYFEVGLKETKPLIVQALEKWGDRLSSYFHGDESGEYYEDNDGNQGDYYFVAALCDIAEIYQKIGVPDTAKEVWIQAGERILALGQDSLDHDYDTQMSTYTWQALFKKARLTPQEIDQKQRKIYEENENFATLAESYENSHTKKDKERANSYWLKAAEKSLGDRDYIQAEEFLKKANLDKQVMYIKIANFAEKNEQFEVAADYWSKVGETNLAIDVLKRSHNYNALAQFYRDNNRPEDAKKVFIEAAEKTNTGRPITKAQYYKLGREEEKAREIVDAEVKGVLQGYHNKSDYSWAIQTLEVAYPRREALEKAASHAEDHKYFDIAAEFYKEAENMGKAYQCLESHAEALEKGYYGGTESDAAKLYEEVGNDAKAYDLYRKDALRHLAPTEKFLEYSQKNGISREEAVFDVVQAALDRKEYKIAASIYQAEGQEEKAIKLWEDVIQNYLQTDDPEKHFSSIAEIYENELKDTESAIMYWRKAGEQELKLFNRQEAFRCVSHADDPDDSNGTASIYEAIRLFSRAGDDNRASELSGKANEDDEDYKSAGIEFEKAEKYDDAIRNYRKALRELQKGAVLDLDGSCSLGCYYGLLESYSNIERCLKLKQAQGKKEEVVNEAYFRLFPQSCFNNGQQAEVIFNDDHIVVNTNGEKRIYPVERFKDKG